MAKSAGEKKRRGIRAEMIAQLEAVGERGSNFIDLIDDYMALYDVKNKLQEDIKMRGVVYEDYSSVGVKMQKNNPSVKELTAVNRQMLMIIKELGLRPGELRMPEEDSL